MPKKRGKKYIEAAKKVEAAVAGNGNGGLEPAAAVALAKETSISKFDATVEAHIRLGVDPRHAEQMVRGSVVLPNGTGKKVRVAVFAVGDRAREAEEAGADVVSLGELQYSKATSQPVRVVLAVPDSAPWQSAADMPEGVRISTEFPSLTKRFLDTRGVKAMVIPSHGATEAKVPDIVDAIVDLTETGSSLRKNGLRILETLLTSYTELIASGPAFADADKRTAMEDIALLLRGAIQARGHVLLKLNVAADRLAAVTDMLPALSSPTITTLARGNMNAVETVVPKRGVNTLIPALKAAGAQDILEIPISKIVE